MGSKGIALSSAAGSIVGFVVGLGLGRLVAGTPGQRSSGQAHAVLALSIAGAAGGAAAGSYLSASHVLSLPQST